MWAAATADPAIGAQTKIVTSVAKALLFKRATRLGDPSAAKGKANCRYHIVAENLKRAVEFLFGCWHRDLSRPFTLSGWTYEVCLNCGKKFAYLRADIGCKRFPQRDAENPFPGYYDSE
jgi:hypothetical protein